MYVVTFYSFKGGTGRSMALANVAADLLARNRRVLIVDFDLEAPGLDTFPIKLTRPVSKGIVEMINDYLDSDAESTPAVDEYIYPAHIAGVTSGSLWLMPAGCSDSSYDSRFRDIDWQDFYKNQGGFLFFEDLKAQWLQLLDPDYVLIDSRTGHTDIGGICTRQLPDCVVAMFVPNEQNLRGLVPVVHDIREEEKGPLQKGIDLHFVMGNVPDLDDEDEILSKSEILSKNMLGYEELAATIHHFNSLSMLEQRLMVVERPRSKIALEYKQLVSSIVRLNLEDRDGAIAVLDHAISDLRKSSDVESVNSLEEKLQNIRTLHSTDQQVLARLAKFRRGQRRAEDALDVYDQLLQLDGRDSESLVGRAEVFTILSKPDLALKDLIIFFSLSQVSAFSFVLASRLLLANDRTQISMILESPAIALLPVRAVLDLIHDLQRTYETSDVGLLFLRRWGAANRSADAQKAIAIDLSLCLIAVGHFEEAKQEIARGSGIEALDLPDSFNYTMAEWGLRGELPLSLFQIVVPKISGHEDTSDPNRLQCFSLAYWAVGNNELARKFLIEANEHFATAPRSLFSAWTYLIRSPKDFKADLDAMDSMYTTGQGIPAFIRDTANLFPFSSLLQ
jgi:MinD-like ATPase involved in chromosome partitioning or flagellar assembly